MKQFKTDEEQFRKFIIKTERLILSSSSFKMLSEEDIKTSFLILNQITEYKKELGMLKHPDAVKSDRYIEQEIPFTHD